MSNIRSFRELIDHWPSVTAFSTAIAVGYEAARKMHDRDSISDTHWSRVVSEAAKIGVKTSVQELADLKAARHREALRKRPHPKSRGGHSRVAA